MTTTTRLGLTKPAGSDLVDISVLNANSDKIDAAIGAKIVTSGTRPSTPFDGQIIYETDTGKTYAYRTSNTTWNSIDKPVGIVTSSSRPGSPFLGQLIYETDTTRMYVYNSDWILVTSAVAATSTTKPTALAGQIVYETDTHSTYVYSGSYWMPIGKSPVVNASVRDLMFPTPKQGDQVYVSTAGVGYMQMYYELRNDSTNPGGAATAGWYPAPGTNISGAFARNNASLSIATGVTKTLVSGFTNAYAVNGVAVSADEAYITVPVTGYYRVSANLSWSSGAGSTYRYMFVSRNQTTDTTPSGSNMVLAQVMQPAGTSFVTNHVSQIVQLTSGDVLRLAVNQNSGSTLTIADNTGPYGYNTGLSVEWIGVV